MVSECEVNLNNLYYKHGLDINVIIGNEVTIVLPMYRFEDYRKVMNVATDLSVIDLIYNDGNFIYKIFKAYKVMYYYDAATSKVYINLKYDYYTKNELLVNNL